jgi:putative ubiquitin-RnfH superfamily antitoxin RatB of RatAB toxin-antitoxin module
MENSNIRIEVAYATAKEQVIIPVEVSDSSTIEQVIEKSNILKRFPDIDLTKNGVGIFSKATTLNATVQAGDRIEIYRPLLGDPKEIRKRYAEKKAKEKENS